MNGSQLEEREQNETGGHEKIDGGIAAGEQAKLDQIAAGLKDDEGQVGEGWKGGEAKPENTAKKKWLMGGGVVAGVGVTGTFAFLALIPLKINTIVENIQDRYFATTESATDRWSEKLFSNYIARHVLPSMPRTNCRGTIDRTCVNVANVTGNSPAARLYNGWKDARIEEKLADKYGIEFTRENETFDMKINGRSVVSGPLANADGLIADGGGRKDVRRAYREAMKNETKFKRALYRFKVGNLLERKYGVKRCMFACDSRDNFADWRDRKRDGFKIKLVERVISPRSENLAIVMQCIVTGGCRGAGDTSPDGERRDEFQKKVDAKLAELAARIGTEAVEDLISSANGILDKGFSRYLVERIISKVTNDATGRIAGKAVPVVGWIDLAAELITVATSLGPTLKKMAYVTNAAAMVSTYMSYRTMADEMKSGNVDPELLGSMVSSLSGNEFGGSAESSPMYQDIMGVSETTTAISSIFPSTYAAPAVTGERCNDGSFANSVDKVCPEDSLKTSNFITAFSDFINNSPLTLSLRTVGSIWNRDLLPGPGEQSLNGLYDAVGNTIGSIINVAIGPLMDQLEQLVADPLGELTQTVSDKLIPSPFPSNPDETHGAKNITIAIGGGNEAGNNFAHYGAGGRALTPVETAAILNGQENERQAVFANLSLKDRVFSTDTTRSLVSRVAMSMPLESSTTVAGGTMAAIVRSPFSMFSNFSSFLSPKKVKAAVASEDPYGITQYGLPTDDPAFNTDPETLTDEACTAMTAAWSSDDNIRVNTETGMDEHENINICKLNESTVTGLGAIYTDSVLEAQDRSAGSIAPGAAGPVQQGVDTSAQACPSDPLITDGGIADKHGPGRVFAYRIRLCLIKGLGGFDVNVSIAQNVANLVRGADATGLNLTGGGYRTFDEQVILRGVNGCENTYTSSPSSCDVPTAIPGRSNHESGEAIDFRCNGGSISNGVKVGGRWTAPGNLCWVYLEANARNFGLNPLNSEAWHWSVSGG